MDANVESIVVGDPKTINTEPIAWANNVNYLRCNFLSRACTADPKQGTGKFYGAVNNISFQFLDEKEMN